MHHTWLIFICNLILFIKWLEFGWLSSTFKNTYSNGLIDRCIFDIINSKFSIRLVYFSMSTSIFHSESLWKVCIHLIHLRLLHQLPCFIDNRRPFSIARWSWIYNINHWLLAVMNIILRIHFTIHLVKGIVNLWFLASECHIVDSWDLIYLFFLALVILVWELQLLSGMVGAIVCVNRNLIHSMNLSIWSLAIHTLIYCPNWCAHSYFILHLLMRNIFILSVLISVLLWIHLLLATLAHLFGVSSVLLSMIMNELLKFVISYLPVTLSISFIFHASDFWIYEFFKFPTNI